MIPNLDRLYFSQCNSHFLPLNSLVSFGRCMKLERWFVVWCGENRSSVVGKDTKSSKGQTESGGKSRCQRINLTVLASATGSSVTRSVRSQQIHHLRNWLGQQYLLCYKTYHRKVSRHQSYFKQTSCAEEWNATLLCKFFPPSSGLMATSALFVVALCSNASRLEIAL